MTIFLVHDGEDIPIPLLEEFPIEHGTAPAASLPENSVIVQWGMAELSGEFPGAWVLNGAEGIRNCHREIWRELLPMHGIAVGDEGQPYRKAFIVLVFQQNVFGMYSDATDVWLADEMRSRRTMKEIGLNDESRDVRKARQIAVRAIYALGLDFGMVKLGMDPKLCAVLDISPKIPSHLSARLGKEILAFADLVREPVEPDLVLLGADPEFVLRQRNGKFVLASRFFPKNGEIGCDRMWLRGDQSRSKLPIAELRPQPSADPRRLAKTIHSCLVKAAEMIGNEEIEFLAGSVPLKGYPIGGHIHFSHIPLNSFLLRALDNYLALPAFMLEDPGGIRRRPKYGYTGDFRRQPHGGFEYRTLFSWLATPGFTKGTLALAKLVAVSYPRLRRTPLSHPPVQRAFYQGKKEDLRPVVEYLWGEIESQPLYKEYEKLLASYKECVLNLRHWLDALDIRPRWRIPPFSPKGVVL